jgi:predicted nuclease with TOPRIM domain
MEDSVEMTDRMNDLPCALHDGRLRNQERIMAAMGEALNAIKGTTERIERNLDEVSDKVENVTVAQAKLDTKFESLEKKVDSLAKEEADGTWISRNWKTVGITSAVVVLVALYLGTQLRSDSQIFSLIKMLIPGAGQ